MKELNQKIERQSAILSDKADQRDISVKLISVALAGCYGKELCFYHTTIKAGIKSSASELQLSVEEVSQCWQKD